MRASTIQVVQITACKQLPVLFASEKQERFNLPATSSNITPVPGMEARTLEIKGMACSHNALQPWCPATAESESAAASNAEIRWSLSLQFFFGLQNSNNICASCGRQDSCTCVPSYHGLSSQKLLTFKSDGGWCRIKCVPYTAANLSAFSQTYHMVSGYLSCCLAALQSSQRVLM